MGGAKKSVYIFLSSLLGVLLFLVLHRILILSYLLLVLYGVFHWTSNYSYVEFASIDYITLLLAMICGSWYGIWLGNYWYEQVYELGVWPGAARHLRHKFFPASPGHLDLKAKIEIVRQNLAEDLSTAKILAKEIPREILMPAPITRRPPGKKTAAARNRRAGKTKSA